MAGGRPVSDGTALAIYRDLLEPELIQLRIREKEQLKHAIRKASLKVGIPAAAVALGLHAGLLPTQLADLLKAVGGMSLVNQLADLLVSTDGEPREIKSHHLYFLLRLEKQAS